MDALIIRDLMTLARERAIAAAYVLGGDEDLRAGVEAAQDMGIRVCVIGIDNPAERNQADTLIREADEHLLLNKKFLADFFTRVITPPKTAVKRDWD
ncbi:MAG: NYN domain-containing protein, partial [Gammaproteobacteria bacterium]